MIHPEDIYCRTPSLFVTIPHTTMCIYPGPDLTPKERETNRQLHTELKRRKQAGETNLMIKRGKIIIRQTNPQLSPSNNNSAMELGDNLHLPPIDYLFYILIPEALSTNSNNSNH